MPGHSMYTESGSDPAAACSVQSPRNTANWKLPPVVSVPLRSREMFVVNDASVAPGAFVFSFDAIVARMSLYVAMLAV